MISSWSSGQLVGSALACASVAEEQAVVARSRHGARRRTARFCAPRECDTNSNGASRSDKAPRAADLRGRWLDRAAGLVLEHFVAKREAAGPWLEARRIVASASLDSRGDAQAGQRSERVRIGGTGSLAQDHHSRFVLPSEPEQAPLPGRRAARHWPASRSCSGTCTTISASTSTPAAARSGGNRSPRAS